MNTESSDQHDYYGDLIKIIKEILELEFEYPRNKFQEIFYANYVRCYESTLAIDILILDDYGDQAMDIARSIIENVIGINYIYAEDTKQRLKRFMQFRHIERQKEYKYRLQIGHKINKDELSSVRNNYYKNKKKYIKRGNDKNETRNDWADRSVDQMLESLEKSAWIDEEEFHSLKNFYRMTSLRNHLSPLVTIGHMDKVFTSNYRDRADYSTHQAQIAEAIILYQMSMLSAQYLYYMPVNRQDKERVGASIKNLNNKLNTEAKRK